MRAQQLRRAWARHGPRAGVLLLVALLLSGLCGLQLHRSAAAALRRSLRPAPRTNAALLLQHYAARELLFRRGAKRIYFLHIHKARRAAHGCCRCCRVCAEPRTFVRHPALHAGRGQHAVPAGDGRRRAGGPRRQLQPAGRRQARAGGRRACGAVPRVPVRFHPRTLALLLGLCGATLPLCARLTHARRGVCAAHSAAAVSFVANERGLPDEPHFEAEGVYVAVLREPRARYLSQYLHVKEYGEAYLRVRAPRRRLCSACVRAAPVGVCACECMCSSRAHANTGRAQEVARRAAPHGRAAVGGRAVARRHARRCECVTQRMLRRT
jgi:hypothetical protein